MSMYEYDLKELRSMETVQVGVYGELKIETNKERVWIDYDIVTTEVYVHPFGWDVDDKPYKAL